MNQPVYFAFESQLYRCSRRNFVRLLHDKANGLPVAKSLMCDYRCVPVGSGTFITLDGWDAASLQSMADSEQRKLDWKPKAIAR